ncbi:hypothetical protein BH09PLA1_BH09PLA1_36660 [soil metagenome]
MAPKLLMRIVALAAVAASVPLIVVGCTPKVAIEGGDKPIKIDMTITLKVDRELDQFYSFEKKYEQSTTQPATSPTN